MQRILHTHSVNLKKSTTPDRKLEQTPFCFSDRQTVHRLNRFFLLALWAAGLSLPSTWQPLFPLSLDQSSFSRTSMHTAPLSFFIPLTFRQGASNRRHISSREWACGCVPYVRSQPAAKNNDCASNKGDHDQAQSGTYRKGQSGKNERACVFLLPLSLQSIEVKANYFPASRVVQKAVFPLRINFSCSACQISCTRKIPESQKKHKLRLIDDSS